MKHHKILHTLQNGGWFRYSKDTSAVRVPVERATGLNTRAHNSEKRYDRPHVATHFYHLYTYTIDIQPENRVLVS